DSLTPYGDALWQGLSADDQRRFLRHVRPWWDVHRHRIAPEVAQTLARLVADGSLQISAGRIISAEADGDSVAVSLRPRGSATERRERFAYVFNCTGPLH